MTVETINGEIPLDQLVCVILKKNFADVNPAVGSTNKSDSSPGKSHCTMYCLAEVFSETYLVYL